MLEQKSRRDKPKQFNHQRKDITLSHVSSVDIKITDLDALKKAVSELGCTFVEGKKNYTWYGRHVGDYPLPEGVKKSDLGKCSHVIQVPGTKYEVGLVEQEDGSYEFMFDFWGPGQVITKKLGTEVDGKFENLNKLGQCYTKHKTEALLMQEGYSWQQSVDEHGNITLEVMG